MSVGDLVHPVSHLKNVLGPHPLSPPLTSSFVYVCEVFILEEMGADLG